MSKKKPQPSARTTRRAEARAHTKARARLEGDRRKLAALEEGGSPTRPRDVRSASLVELHAREEPCLACGAEVRVADHAATGAVGSLLRVVRVECPMCGAPRTFYFRVVTDLVS